MTVFLCGLAFLLVGYFTYGKLVERIVGPDDRVTPAVAQADGVDYMVLPRRTNMLLQLLNIAGSGPVIGVIIGIKFGKAVFFIIPIGCVLAGATHDYLCGMMSIRNNGANLPQLIRNSLGKWYAHFFSWFMIALLMLIVVVGINVPAELCNQIAGAGCNLFWPFAGIIVLYYIGASLFPLDKFIGRIYPVFGAMLIIGTGAILVSLLLAGFRDPTILQESAGFKENMFHPEHAPIIPLLFVTIACGILSGFHGTQTPIVARTLKSEREARITFYGMMILEGVIAMTWAGAAMAVYNQQPELMNGSTNAALLAITTHFLGGTLGTCAALSVIALIVSDATLRTVLLEFAGMAKKDVTTIRKRLRILLPLLGVIGIMTWWSCQDANSFNFLWNYFAWGNQVIAASSLMAAAVWLYQQRKCHWIALLPGCFMTYIVSTYILWTSKKHEQAFGFGLDITVARIAGLAIAALFIAFTIYRGKRLRREASSKLPE